MNSQTADLAQVLAALPERWRAVVRDRRQLSAVDPAADALEQAAAELDAAFKVAAEGARMVRTAEWARARSVGAGTVRKWCVRGELPGATQDDRGQWMIPTTAKRERKARR